MQLGQPLIAERSPVLSGQSQSTYIVQAGDTLCSIAWRYELDYQGLARANSIRAPYVIRSGQKLRLITQLPPGRRLSERKAKASSSSKGQAVAKVPKKAPSTKPAVNTRTTWVWPLQLDPAVEYGPSSKGMDFRLSGTSARARAAAAGKVVYAGSGIGGFERLVIIKHSASLLSAYGFDGQLSVREQQQVQGGMEIAQIKRRGATQFALHFELRRNGQPINPRSLLR